MTETSSITSFAGGAYLVAAVLFVLSLAGLVRHESARRGVAFGIGGMTLALLTSAVVVLDSIRRDDGAVLLATVLLVLAVTAGAVPGLYKARSVEMTAMPELIALLHSFVGLAAVLVSWNSFLAHDDLDGALGRVHRAEVSVGIFIGAVTVTGSLVAYLKLSGRIGSAPLRLPHRNLLNLGALVAFAIVTIWCVAQPSTTLVVVTTVLALLLGWHLVISIGGGDMPVVISMLNSYSGWAAAASGFLLSNDLLIVTGALVGSSGAYLSYVMCVGMNRSFLSVIAGGFGVEPTDATHLVEGEHHESTVADVVTLLEHATSVVVVPGYGMAVAQAQGQVAELTRKLRDRGVEVRFAIHPVAGRLPGHMNVLLAEAKIPYDIVLELDEVNDDFGETSVVLVIGANDTVNPAAAEDPGSPIAGMPVLNVWEAEHVVVFKRSLATGYAGVPNPLFVRDNTAMLFGDARQRVGEIVKSLWAEEPRHRLPTATGS